MTKQEKYITCDRCEAKILENCAIEEDGLMLCGDCIVKNAKKDVAIAAKKAATMRKEIYDTERKALVLKQKKRGLIILFIAIVAFAGTQWFVQQNKPVPIKNANINYATNLHAAHALITIGLYDYMVKNNQLPDSLQRLHPDYLPLGVNTAFKSFKYKKIDTESYELEMITTINNAGATDEK